MSLHHLQVIKIFGSCDTVLRGYQVWLLVTPYLLVIKFVFVTSLHQEQLTGNQNLWHVWHSTYGIAHSATAAALNDRPAPGDTVRTGNQICVCLCDVTEPLTGNQNFWDLWHRTYGLSNSNYRLLVTPYLRVIEIFLNLCVCVCVCDVTAPRTTYR